MTGRNLWWRNGMMPTNAMANDLFEVQLVTGEASSAKGRIFWHITDGADGQTALFAVEWVFINIGGVPVVALEDVSLLDDYQSGASTLTIGTWTFTAAADKVTVGCTPNTSLAPTVYDVDFGFEQRSPANIVPLL